MLLLIVCFTSHQFLLLAFHVLDTHTHTYTAIHTEHMHSVAATQPYVFYAARIELNDELMSLHATNNSIEDFHYTIANRFSTTQSRSCSLWLYHSQLMLSNDRLKLHFVFLIVFVVYIFDCLCNIMPHLPQMLTKKL